MYTVTGSIVAYKTPTELLKRAVGSFQTYPGDKRLAIVDNSPDDSLRGEVSDWTGVTYIHSGENRGYGAGHNRAIRQYLHRAQYHVVLNPDVYFAPGTLEAIVSFMDQNPEIAQLMPRVVDANGREQFLAKLLPRPSDVLIRRFLRDTPTSDRINQRYELRFADHGRIIEAPYLSGCFMFLRMSCLREVGLFDERFFMYPEDIDLTRRLHRNYRTVFYPGATIVHDHARESYKSLWMLLVHARNLARYFSKWGWLHDRERSEMNRRTLERLGR